MDAPDAAAFGLGAALVLAGCLVPVPGTLLPPGADAEPAPRPTWSADDWWAFHVEVPGGGSADASFVVHEAGPDGYRLGSNRSTGFFGIPFHGELEPDLDPWIAGERWDMFRFPLEDGDSWVQEFLGHVVRTHVHAAQLETPDGEAVDGYRMEAKAYGVSIATYTYSPETGWLTKFTLRDPETGDVLAWANLTDRGRTYEGRYLVEEQVHRLERSYPGDLPGEEPVPVDGEGTQLVATLTGTASPGWTEARLEDPDGETVVEVEARGSAVENARETWPAEDGTWHLDHRGAGSGSVRLQIHAVREAGDGAGEVGSPGDDPLDGSVAEAILGLGSTG